MKIINFFVLIITAFAPSAYWRSDLHILG